MKGKGRVPSYCSQTCKQVAYLKRRHRGPMELLAQDIATMRVRAVIRKEVMYCLEQLGLVTPGARHVYFGGNRDNLRRSVNVPRVQPSQIDACCISCRALKPLILRASLKLSANGSTK